MPWQGSGSSDSKYKYNDASTGGVLKDAPSALHAVVIPNVNLPKVCYRDGYTVVDAC
jgi:hypothetical protein